MERIHHMKRIIFSVMFAIIFSATSASFAFAVTCDKATEEYENGERSEASKNAVCDAEKSAPQASAAPADKPNKPRKPQPSKPTPAPESAQVQAPQSPASAPASTDVMNAIGAIKAELEAMKAEANKAKQVQNESFIEKLNRNKVLIYSIGTFLMVPLMVVIIFLQLRHRKVMGAYGRRIQSLSGGGPSP